MLEKAVLVQTLASEGLDVHTLLPDESNLMTNLGLIKLNDHHSGLAQSMRFSGYSLHNTRNQISSIVWNNHRILWLPMEYRTVCQAFHGNCLAIGHASGHETLIGIREDLCPIA